MSDPLEQSTCSAVRGGACNCDVAGTDWTQPMHACFVDLRHASDLIATAVARCNTSLVPEICMRLHIIYPLHVG